MTDRLAIIIIIIIQYLYSALKSCKRYRNADMDLKLRVPLWVR